MHPEAIVWGICRGCLAQTGVTMNDHKASGGQ